MTTTPRKITSREFGQALATAGIVRDIENVRRIVIDAEAGELLRLYVEYFGDERWLNVALALDGVEVITSPLP